MTITNKKNNNPHQKMLIIIYIQNLIFIISLINIKSRNYQDYFR